MSPLRHFRMGWAGRWTRDPIEPSIAATLARAPPIVFSRIRSRVSAAFALLVAACGAPQSAETPDWSETEQGRRAIAQCKRTRDPESVQCKLATSLGRVPLEDLQHQSEGQLERGGERAADQSSARERAAPGVAPCSRARSRQELEHDAELSGSNVEPTPQMISARLAKCIHLQIAKCQLAIDEGVGTGIDTCGQMTWTQIPDGMLRAELSDIVPCLREVKLEQEALANCIARTEPKRDELRCPQVDGRETCGRSRGSFLRERAACMKSQESPQASCPQITITRAWSRFRTSIKFDQTFEEARSAACEHDRSRVAAAVHDKDSRRAEQALVEADVFCTAANERAKVVELRDRLRQQSAFAIPGWEDVVVGRPPPKDAKQKCTRTKLKDSVFVRCRGCRSADLATPCITVGLESHVVSGMSPELPRNDAVAKRLQLEITQPWGTPTKVIRNGVLDTRCWSNGRIAAVAGESWYEIDPKNSSRAIKRRYPLRSIVISSVDCF